MGKKKILVVEDEFVTATALRVTLEGYGFEVVGTVDTGEDAIRTAGELKPDLILMDIQLIGGMNGIAAAGIIRKNHDIPVIYVTGQSDDATIATALESEPFGYIIKPFEEKNLKTSITMALYKHAMEQRLERQNEELLKLTAALDGMNDCVIITGYAGQIEYVNAAFARRFGYAPADVVGKDFAMLASPENLFPVSRREFVDDSKKVWAGNFSGRHKAGTVFKMTFRSTPIIKENRTLSRVFVLREML